MSRGGADAGRGGLEVPAIWRVVPRRGRADTTASALAFARSFHVSYPSVSDQRSAITLDFTAKVPIAGTPTTLVVDRTGHIAGAVFGTVTYPELTAILAKVTAKGG